MIKLYPIVKNYKKNTQCGLLTYQHLKEKADKTLIICEGGNPEVNQDITYQMLYDEVFSLEPVRD